MQSSWSLEGPVPESTAEAAVALDALAERVAAGDRAAFDLVYRALVDELYSYVRGQCRSDADAEDIVAGVFLKAWRSASRYRLGSQSFRPWMYGIARNEVRNHWRLSDQSLPLADTEIAAPADNSFDEAGAQLFLTSAMSTLTPEQREVVVLRYFNEKPHREIAQIMGKREGSIRALLHRALQHMRTAMLQATP